MCKYIDGNNIIEFAVFIKFGGYMAIIIINYQHLIHIGGVLFCMFIEMLNSI